MSLNDKLHSLITDLDEFAGKLFLKLDLEDKNCTNIQTEIKTLRQNIQDLKEISKNYCWTFVN